MAKTFGLGTGPRRPHPASGSGIATSRRSRSSASPATRTSRATGSTRRETAELAASITAARRAPADRGAGDGRRGLRADRRRAPAARRADGGAHAASPPSCATPPTASSSSWRWSRTSSGRTSTRSRRPPPTASWSTASRSRTRKWLAEVGKSRVAISNALRLLDLTAETREAIADGRISEGHGRALAALTVPELQRAALLIVLERHLSVRQTEELVRRKRDAAPIAVGAQCHLRRPGRPRGAASRPARHQGRHRAHAPRGPPGDRLLLRRGAGSAARDHRARRGEVARDRAAGAAPASHQGRIGLHRREHPGARGPERGAQAAEHVHRLDRLARPASARLGDRRQQHRRGDGQRRHADRRHAPRGRPGGGRRRRARHPGRQAPLREGRPRGRPHRAPRRRQVRRRRLQGLRWPPRRRA